MIRQAVLSDDGVYRWSLSRVWDQSLPQVAWVMLNPSTADGEQDDPTVRKCIGFSQRWGYGSLVIVNLFAFRATKPRDLVAAQNAGVNVTGRENEAWITKAVSESAAVVAAWGSHDAAFAASYLALKTGSLRGAPLRCIGRNANGAPTHPLMARYIDEPYMYP